MGDASLVTSYIRSCLQAVGKTRLCSRRVSACSQEKEAKVSADTRMAQTMLREYGNHLESSEEELFDQKAELHSASSESEPDSDADLLPSEPPPKRGSVSSRRSGELPASPSAQSASVPSSPLRHSRVDRGVLFHWTPKQ